MQLLYSYIVHVTAHWFAAFLSQAQADVKLQLEKFDKGVEDRHHFHAATNKANAASTIRGAVGSLANLAVLATFAGSADFLVTCRRRAIIAALKQADG